MRHSPLDFFRTPKYEYDACQSIVATFTDSNHDQLEKLPSFCGQNGPCGAAYGATFLRPDLEDIIIQEFKVEAGGICCQEILKAGKRSCTQCVLLASQLLDDFLLQQKEKVIDEWWKCLATE